MDHIKNNEPNFIKVSDLAAPELRLYSGTSEVQLLRCCEPEPGVFIAESARVILRALEAGYTPLSLLVEERQANRQALDVIARCGDIPVYTASLEVLTQITGFHLTQGVLCAMRRHTLPQAGEICAGKRRVAVLEDITNQTNVGAVFRSAAALGFDALLLTRGCCDPLYRRSVRVSMGTVFQIPWTWLESSDTNYVDQLKQMGFATAAMALKEDCVAIDDARLTAEKRLAVLLGNEDRGLRASTIAACDYAVKIPMSHGVDSLNVAAASAVAFWQLGKRKP